MVKVRMMLLSQHPRKAHTRARRVKLKREKTQEAFSLSTKESE
jgi:hypothetical protein